MIEEARHWRASREHNSSRPNPFLALVADVFEMLALWLHTHLPSIGQFLDHTVAFVAHFLAILQFIFSSNWLKHLLDWFQHHPPVGSQ